MKQQFNQSQNREFSSKSSTKIPLLVSHDIFKLKFKNYTSDNTIFGQKCISIKQNSINKT